MRARRTRTVLLVGALVATALAVASTTASGDETTMSSGNLRTAWDASEPGLSQSAVSQSDFGQLFATTLPAVVGTSANQVYAQPIVANGKVIVATEENQVDALDPATGAMKWSVNLGPSWPASAVNCGDLAPDFGVTSTPVYDSSTKTIYLGAKTNDGPDVDHPHFYLHALNADTGAERVGWPVAIAGQPSNGGAAFNAKTANQRPGLLLLDGAVYLGFASHCDHGPYVGYIAGVNVTNRTQTLWAAETGSSTAEAGIWQSGGALASDGPGRIYTVTGNGISPAPGAGTSPPNTLAESVVRLAVNPDGTLTAKDYFSPSGNTKLDANDADLGSGAPNLLPDSFGTPTHPHLTVVGGKNPGLYLLDRDDLGGTAQGTGGPDHKDRILDFATLPSGLWGHVAAFSAPAANYLYLIPNGRPMQVYTVSPVGGVPKLANVGHSPDSFGYTSGSPVVTSTGSDPSSALVWAIQSSGASGLNGKLVAYDAVPSSSTLHLRFSAPLGTVSKFSQPATDGGRVYVATRDGVVYGFGRPTTSPLATPPAEFGTQPVGTTSAATSVTVTASAAITITSAATSAPFAVNPAGLPASLTAGQSLTLPVTLTPATTGTIIGTLTLQTSFGPFTVDLHGVGTAPGLSADPPSVDFGSVVTGLTKNLSIVITNTSTVAETITGVTLPGAPFTVTGVPAPGTVLAGQQAITLSASFTSAAVGPFDRQLIIASSQGSVTVGLHAVSIAGSANMVLTPTALDFGQVQPGASAVRTFTVSNEGAVPMTITIAAPPTAPFTVASPIGEGQVLNPGDELTQTVTVRPTSAQPATSTFQLTADDGHGRQQVELSVNTGLWPGLVRTGYGSCLGTRAGAGAIGTVVVSAVCADVASQQVRAPGDGTLHLLNKCFGLQGGRTVANTPIVIGACSGGVSQKFTFRADHSLYSAYTNKCLRLQGGAHGANVALVLDACAYTSSEHVDLTPLLSARGQIQNPSQLCVDVRQSRTVNGTVVQQFTCNQTAAQIIASPANGALMVLGKCVEVLHSGKASGTVVDLWDCNGTATQLWKQVNGTLVNINSKLCLTAPSGAVSTQLQVRTCNGSPSQRWPLST